jgi:SAM-dependent methyltransferase
MKDARLRMQPDFVDVTEIANTPITDEARERLVSRYSWAKSFCQGKDAVEIGCGTGPGLGMLASAARSFEAGDYSEKILGYARQHYGNRIPLRQLDAQSLPFANRSKDVIILFEALYYVPEPERFAHECARVLRPGGRVLISTANKDLWDFHPSPFSHHYLGVVELRALFGKLGFDCQFFGFQPVQRAPARQQILRPLKRAAVALGVMPKTMNGKRWLKRIVFGREIPMPAELGADEVPRTQPEPLEPSVPDRRHKIVYCAATLKSTADTTSA